MDTAAVPYTLFFAGKDDPRENVVIIGETSAPVCYRFETPIAPGNVHQALEPRTSVSQNETPVAAFDWTLGGHLGTTHLWGQQIPMAKFVEKGSKLSARRFVSHNGYPYEWAQSDDDAYGYDLLGPRGTRLAEFRRTDVQHPQIGPLHALLLLWFDDENVLLEALLALCINRWIDWHGSTY